jgi:hypothetical protein
MSSIVDEPRAKERNPKQKKEECEKIISARWKEYL